MHLVQTAQRSYIRLRRGGASSCDIIQPRLQGQGGRLMVWGAFSSQGVIPLVRLHGNLNAVRYTEVLDEHVRHFIHQQPHFIFMQDNAKPHTTNATTRFLQENNINVLQWPANSPDLNPIENLWGALKSELDRREIHGMQQLFDVALEIFVGFDQQMLDNLIESMPRHCREVIKRNGWHIKY